MEAMAFSLVDSGSVLKRSFLPTNVHKIHYPILQQPQFTRSLYVRAVSEQPDKRDAPNLKASLDLLQIERTKSNLSARWKEIQGSKDWTNLLDPLDPVLRSEVIRYGEFTQVCYDSFDYDMNSRYCGSCKHKKSKLFEETGLLNTGYEVTKYLYATSKSDIDIDGFFRKPKDQEDAWSNHSNWMGYVAVCTSEEEIKRLGRRDIVVSWRGTVTQFEWIEDLKNFLVPGGLDASKVKVEKGFLHLYTSKSEKSRYNKQSAREQVLGEIGRLVNKYIEEELSITVTGHSLGGALALLSGYDMAQSGLTKRTRKNKAIAQSEEASKNLHPMFETEQGVENGDLEIPLTVLTFGGPRVGNEAFKERCEELRVKTLRVVNEKDLVPKTPGLFTNEKLGMLINFLDNLPWTYSHVGAELRLTTDLSPYLRPSNNPLDHHNLEGHLHLIDGFHGSGKEFKSATDRDLALVNKSSGFLRPHLKIPSSWWQDRHKGLVRDANGKWVQPERDDD